MSPPPTGADAALAALGDPTRRRVLELVALAGPVTSTQLADGLPVSRQAVAKHLAALEGAGLVRAERVGRESRYSLVPDGLDPVAAWVERVGSQWDDRLRRLGRHVGGA